MPSKPALPSESIEDVVEQESSKSADIKAIWKHRTRLVDTIAQSAQESPDPVILLDTHGKVLYANHAWRPSGTDIPIGEPFRDHIVPEHRDAFWIAFLDAVSPGLTHRVEFALPGRAGPRHYLANVYAVKEQEPAPDTVVGVIVNALDVTAQRKELERLRRSEALMVDAEGIAHLGTWEWDITQPHAVWSREMYKIYGLEPATHTPTYQDYLTRVHEDDRERVRLATEAMFNDHVPVSHDERIHRADGALRYLHTWAEPVVDASGKLERMIGVCLDITDRKAAESRLAESEARFRAIFEHAPFGVATLGPDGGFLQTNPAMQRMTGFDEMALQRKTLQQLAEPGQARLAEVAIQGAFGPDADTKQVELPLRHAEGGSFTTKIAISPCRSATNEDPFAVAILRDLSAAQAAADAEKLARARLDQIESLQEVSEWKTQLLRIASHELKNPMTPLRVQLHLLATGRLGDLSEKQADAVTRISDQVQRMSNLVTGVLDAARVEQGRLGLALRDTDVSALTMQLVDASLETAKRCHVHLTAHIDPGLSAIADPLRLEQVLMNLIGNALKFTPKGGHVRVRTHADEGGVRITVEDDGPGLAPEERARVFDAFSQVHDDDGGHQQGLGLGLYIAKAIVEAHQGHIWVESTPGQGCRFHVSLPSASHG